MAFGDLGNTTTGTCTTANQASFSTVSLNLTLDSFYVLIIAVDNNQTTDGDEGAVTSVTDSGGVNVWSKAVEFCNGQGSAQAGATVSIWYSLITSVLVGGTITANFSNSASRDKAAWTLREFSKGAGTTVAIEGTPGTLANDGADPGSLDVTTANIACLRIRGIAAESNDTTALTTTDGTWTAFNGATTTGGGSAANQAVRAEFKISTATGAASNPTLYAADCASAYAAFKEVAGDTLFAQAVM